MTNNSYYEIAKDVAKIIHTKSNDNVCVKDVLLFGSTIRKEEDPKDIDLLILHKGRSLREFCEDPYTSTGERFSNDSAYNRLDDLGYKRDEDLLEGKTWEQEIEIVSEWKKKSVLKEVMTRVSGIIGQDNYGELDNLFDIHALSIRLFERDDEYLTKRRTKAIKSCRDPTFWHTVLSEGKIYDLDKHDFITKVDEKYSSATDLF